MNQEIDFDKMQGLLPAIVQDAGSGEVLMLGFMNREAFEQTLRAGYITFFSRTRNQLWTKGETSGNTQQVVDLVADCDGDAIVVLVKPAGPACHTGARSCFDLKQPEDLGALLTQLYKLIESRERERPEGSYTTYLFEHGLDKILKKVGEESAETIIAAKNEEAKPLVSEVSDLIYHLLVLLVARGVSLDQVGEELARRRK